VTDNFKLFYASTGPHSEVSALIPLGCPAFPGDVHRLSAGSRRMSHASQRGWFVTLRGRRFDRTWGSGEFVSRAWGGCCLIMIECWAILSNPQGARKMDDSTKEMVKAIAEAIKPFAGLAERLLGESFDELGAIAGNELRFRRQKRELILFQKLQKAIEDARIEDPQRIPDNIWVPAVQEALLQSEETMQDKWAAMLANACDPAEQNPVSPAFPHVLRDLSVRDVKFLDALYDDALQRMTGDASLRGLAKVSYSENAILDIYHLAGLSTRRLAFLTLAEITEELKDIEPQLKLFELTFASVKRQEVVTHITGLKTSPGFGMKQDELTTIHRLTEFGVAFIKACRPPRQSA
jgi:hypothetical protein